MLLFLLVIENDQSRELLEKIYLTYHKEMYYIANGILSNSHDAQDVVQTSIIKMIHYIDKIEEVKCNKTKYLIVTIVKNAAIDLYRKKIKQPMIELDEINNEPDLDSPSLDDIIIRFSDAKMLSEQLSKLKNEYADILTLKYYLEFEDKEIADVLKISNENVRVRLFRAKSELRKMMREKQAYNEHIRMCTNEGS